MLLLVTIFSLLLIGYGLIAPLQGLIVRQRLEIKKLQSDQHWLHQQARLAGLVAVKPDATPLTLSIIRTAKKAGLTVQVKENGQKTVLVTTNELPLATLVSWLETLKEEKGIYPLELSFEASNPDKQYIRVVALRLKKAE